MIRDKWSLSAEIQIHCNGEDAAADSSMNTVPMVSSS